MSRLAVTELTTQKSQACHLKPDWKNKHAEYVWCRRVIALRISVGIQHNTASAILRASGSHNSWHTRKSWHMSPVKLAQKRSMKCPNRLKRLTKLEKLVKRPTKLSNQLKKGHHIILKQAQVMAWNIPFILLISFFYCQGMFRAFTMHQVRHISMGGYPAQWMEIFHMRPLYY